MIILLCPFSVVPAHRESLQTDEAVRVVCQHDWIPVKSHLLHFGPHVVAGVPLAECLICYCCYLVVLQKTKREGCEISCCSTFNSCDLQIIVLVGVRHEETLGGAAPMSVHCYRDKDTPVLWVSGGEKRTIYERLDESKLQRHEKCQNHSNIKELLIQTYLKSSSFYTAGFKFVEISIEQD